MAVPEFDQKELVEVLGRKRVIFAYLFGSQARGQSGPGSDVDIAVYLDEGLNRDDRFDLRLRLIGDLSVILQTDGVDLLLLRDLPLFFQYRIVREGKLIFCKDELQRIRFEFRVMSLFFDRQYYYWRHTKSLMAQVAREGIL